MNESWLGRWLRTVICATLVLPGIVAGQGENLICGSLANAYGPFDYRTQRDKLKIVEDYHFTPEVEALIRGKSGTSIAADLSYLLAASPNHHRGLVSLVRLSEKMKNPQPARLRYSVDCYFDRAVRFASDDTVVRVLYALYLNNQANTKRALQQLDAAVNLAGDNAFSHYNIGLAYFEMGQFDRALVQAHKARALGFEETSLARLLQQKNAWTEPAN